MNKGLLLVAAIAALGWYLWAQHETTFRYRLTVNVVSDGQAYSGSGVIQEQVLVNTIRLNGFAWYAKLTGDAVVVEVPGRPPIFALLSTKNDADWAESIAFSMFRDELPDPQQPAAKRENISAMVRLRKKAEIPVERYPMLVAFRDINDPKTVYELHPQDLSDALGVGSYVSSMTIEMTRRGATVGAVARLLPWSANMVGFLNGEKFSSSSALPGRLSGADFVKRGT
jgi:hypothetical protein